MVAPAIGAGIGAASSILGGLATLRGGPRPGSVTEEMLQRQQADLARQQESAAATAASRGVSPGLAQRNAAVATQRASADLASSLAEARAREERAQQQRRDQIVGAMLQGAGGALSTAVQPGGPEGGPEQAAQVAAQQSPLTTGQTATQQATGLEGGQASPVAGGGAPAPAMGQQQAMGQADPNEQIRQNLEAIEAQRRQRMIGRQVGPVLSPIFSGNISGGPLG